MQGILHLAENGVEPLEHLAVAILAPSMGDDPLMVAAFIERRSL